METRTPTLKQHALDLAENSTDLEKKARAESYEPVIASDYQCPICWVFDGVRTTIVPTNSDTDEDRWRCNVRHGDFDAAF